jgi:hypothetical protein
MSDVSRYANERLLALWDRVEHLEHVIERAGAVLEEGGAPEDALGILQDGIMEGFRDALLCNRDTSDAHLDVWMPEIEKHEAQASEPQS